MEVPVKRRERQLISLEVKSKILALKDSGLGLSCIAHKMNLGRSTVQAIIRQRQKIIEALNTDVAKLPKKPKATKKTHGLISLISEMEKLLFNWIQEQRNENIQFTYPVIQKKAIHLFHTVKQNRVGNNDDDRLFFAASRGWCIRFKQRYGLQNLSKEKKANEEMPCKYSDTVWKVILDESLSPKQIFNVTEIGLFWKRLPKSGFARDEQSTPGFKASKDYVTILLGSNAEGDFKLRPLLVYRLENPKELSKYSKACLPVIWKFNAEIGITDNIFEQWYKEHFIPSVKDYCAMNNLAYKALLILDETPWHPRRIADIDMQIKIVLLPPNTMEWLQPMAQGITAMFKACYLKKILTQGAESNNINSVNFTNFWDNFNMLNCLKNIAISWNDIKSSDIRSAWKKVSPLFFNGKIPEDINLGNSVNIICDDIVKIANSLPGVEINSTDIIGWLNSHTQELTNEDLNELHEQTQRDNEEASTSYVTENLLTTNILKMAFNHLQKAMQIFEHNDPDLERSFEVNKKITFAYKCYKDVYEEKRKEEKYLSDLFANQGYVFDSSI